MDDRPSLLALSLPLLNCDSPFNQKNKSAVTAVSIFMLLLSHLSHESPCASNALPAPLRPSQRLRPQIDDSYRRL